MLPKRNTDDVGGELMAKGFHRMLGHLTETEMGWLTEMVLEECQWFPTVAECKAMMARQNYGNKFYRRSSDQIGSAAWFEADKIDRAANRLELENRLKASHAELTAKLIGQADADGTQTS